MAKRSIWAIFGGKSQPPSEPEERPPSDELDLRQWLLPEFADTLTAWLGKGAEPLVVLFVPSERILEWTPGRALVLTADGVLFMEEGESVILNQKWGVKTVFYPYGQIAAVGIGQALLRGRFTLYAGGSAPPCEIILHWYNLNNFRAAARIIREKVAQATGGRQPCAC
jgi:hypothetical protein